MKKGFQILFGLLLISGFLYSVYHLGRMIFLYIKSLESDLAIAIIAASMTILLSVISIVLTKYFERGQEINREMRLKKFLFMKI